jgi:hypothetical protein
VRISNKLKRVDAETRGLSSALGLFSLALGIAEMVAPGKVAKFVGVKNYPLLMKGLGLREMTSGVGILSGPKQSSWLASRVGGDFMDLALLGLSFISPRTKKGKVIAAAAAVAGVTALDLLSTKLSRDQEARLAKG